MENYSADQELKRQTEENHALLLEIHRLTKKINRHMVWEQVMSIIKIAIIVIPLWYAYSMLAPQLKQVYGMYSNLLGNTSESSEQNQEYQLNQEVLNNLSPDAIQQLKRSGLIK